MATKKKAKAPRNRTRPIVAPAGPVKGGESGAKAPTTGADFDMAALHADAALVTRAGIVNGMSPAEIDRRLIAAAVASQS